MVQSLLLLSALFLNMCILYDQIQTVSMGFLTLSSGAYIQNQVYTRRESTVTVYTLRMVEHNGCGKPYRIKVGSVLLLIMELPTTTYPSTYVHGVCF